MVNYIVLASTVGVASGMALLPILGFGSTGVAAGSIAAGWQSSIGNVVAGSTFAGLQSLGATGAGTTLFGAIGGAVGSGLALTTRATGTGTTLLGTFGGAVGSGVALTARYSIRIIRCVMTLLLSYCAYFLGAERRLSKVAKY